MVTGGFRRVVEHLCAYLADDILGVVVTPVDSIRVNQRKHQLRIWFTVGIGLSPGGVYVVSNVDRRRDSQFNSQAHCGGR